MEIICANKLCGKVFKYKGSMSSFKRYKKHSCSRHCQNTIHGLAGTSKHKIWENVRNRSRKKGILFQLSIYDIPDIPKKCPILGIKLKFSNKKSEGRTGPIDSSPSLDRFIPKLGYIKGNIRIISNRANRLRSNGTAKEFDLIAKDAKEIE